MDIEEQPDSASSMARASHQGSDRCDGGDGVMDEVVGQGSFIIVGADRRPPTAAAAGAMAAQSCSWIPHSRLRPKKRVSSAFMPGSQRVVVWTSPMET